MSPELPTDVGDDLGVTRAGVLTDELWAVIEPELPSDVGRRGQRWSDHRRILEGIAWRYRVGAPWRDLPAEFGPWQTVWKRHHRWSLDGTYAKIFLAVQEGLGPRPDQREVIEMLMSVDSTCIRAHQHAAGGRGDRWTAGASPGARPNYTILRPEPDNHALGRSRGGFTTKIHALVDHRMRPVVVRLTPGQAGD